MDSKVIERRRILQLGILGALAAPTLVLAGCAGGDGPRRGSGNFGGGNRSDEKSGGRGAGGGGAGGGGGGFGGR